MFLQPLFSYNIRRLFIISMAVILCPFYGKCISSMESLSFHSITKLHLLLIKSIIFIGFSCIHCILYSSFVYAAQVWVWVKRMRCEINTNKKKLLVDRLERGRQCSNRGFIYLYWNQVISPTICALLLQISLEYTPLPRAPGYVYHWERECYIARCARVFFFFALQPFLSLRHTEYIYICVRCVACCYQDRVDIASL